MGENKTFVIYKHTNKINGKVYIGQTCKDPEERWNKGKGYACCSYFYAAIKKYGWDGFDHEIILNNLTADEANEAEERIIAEYDSTNPLQGYNLLKGGRNKIPDERTRAKMSESHRGEKHPNYGKHLSEETRRKIGESHRAENLSEESRIKMIESQKGRRASKETREKMSKARKGKRVGKDNPMYGKHLSEETKEKIGNAIRGGKHPRSVCVRCVELEKSWNCISDCARELSLNRSNITATCKGKHKTVGGYHFEYV